MEENILVSIVVPVYNVERYLNRCLRSITEQTYDNLQIILVDDGSTDRSAVICDEYAKRDSRAIVIHKENGGLSSARNAGVDVAKGEYTCFLDSDDFLAKDYVKKSVKLCVDCHSDISILNMLYIPEDQNEEDDASGESVRELTKEEAIRISLYQTLFSCCAPSKLYRTEIVKKIRFPQGKLSEDLATCHQFLSEANKVVYSNTNGYYYRQRNNSIMHAFNEKRMDALEWALKIESFCCDYYPQILKAAKCRTFNVAAHLLLDIDKSDRVYRKLSPVLWQEIKRTRISVIIDNSARIRERAAALLSCFGEKVLRFIWNSKIAVKRPGV